MILWIFLLIVVILLSAFLQSKYKVEAFNVSSDDYRPVPSAFYDQAIGHVEPGFPLMEYPTDFINCTLKNAEPLPKQTNDKYLLAILNKAIIDIGDVKIKEPLFQMVESEIISQNEKENKITSRHLVDRQNKIYGIELEITTELDKNTSQTKLIDYKIIGFVFDDKIKMTEPASIVLEEDPYQEYMKDTTFMKDNTYETKYLCNYYDNLRKNGNIMVNPPEGLDCFGAV